MRSVFRIALLGLPLVGQAICEEIPSPTRQTAKETQPIYANAEQAFQDLLNALPEESLHVALNGLTKFKDGVFESGRHGVERVHHENPPLATKLIVAAVQDLKKRQVPSAANNGTQSTASEASTSQVQSSQVAPSSQAPSSQAPASSQAPPPTSQAPASSQPSAVLVPVPVTTTNSAGQVTVASSAILSQPTASVAVAVTTTNDKGSTVVSTETKPAVIFTATNSAGSTFVTTSAVDFAPTPGQVLTTTNSQGSTFLTTYTPDGGTLSSILLITTTGSDGKPSTITSYTYVVPATATGADGQPLPTTTKKPGLQTGAADRNRGMELAVVGGAVGGWLAFLI